jgi:hypothetical protein
MILLDPRCFPTYWKSYRKRLGYGAFIRGLFARPMMADLGDLILPDVIRRPKAVTGPQLLGAGLPVTLLVKPAPCSDIATVLDVLRLLRFQVCQSYWVAPVHELLRSLYRDHGRGAIAVAALYRVEPGLRARPALALIVSRDEPTDLRGLKDRIRRQTGYDYYLVKIHRERMFVGLNSVHIPDSGRMSEETELIEQYRLAPFERNETWPHTGREHIPLGFDLHPEL